MDKAPKHIVAYGIAGTGKSHFASTMNTPQLIAMFDPFGKETPYTDGTFVVEDSIEYSTAIGQVTVSIWDCFAEEDCKTLLRKIMWFREPDNTNPRAYEVYTKFQPEIPRYIKMFGIKTFIFDSITTLCRRLHSAAAAGQLGTPSEKSERGLAGLAAPELEWINQFIGDLTINTVIICHSDYNTSVDRNPDLPQVSVHAYGKMRERFLMLSGDVYRTFKKDGAYVLSVESDNFHAGNNSMKINGIFPNDWKEISKADKTNVTFVQRRRD